jgi:hypothetical protein
MAEVAQLVRALDCGSGGRGFKSHLSPQIKRTESSVLFIWALLLLNSKVAFNLIVNMIVPVEAARLVKRNG